MAIKIARVQTVDRLINQLQQNIAEKIEPIFNNLSGTFVTTLSGCTSVPQALVYWQRATSDAPVTVFFPALTATSNTALATLSGLPKNLWPTSQQTCLGAIMDNGTVVTGIIVIGTDGTVVIYPGLVSTVFTTSGTKGVSPACITYMTAL